MSEDKTVKILPVWFFLSGLLFMFTMSAPKNALIEN